MHRNLQPECIAADAMLHMRRQLLFQSIPERWQTRQSAQSRMPTKRSQLTLIEATTSTPRDVTSSFVRNVVAQLESGMLVGVNGPDDG